MSKLSRTVIVLRRFRELAGMTRKEMALKTNISIATIQRIESGSTDMKVSQLEAYLKALNITLIDVHLAAQSNDYVTDEELAAAARLLPKKKRDALLRFIRDIT